MISAKIRRDKFLSTYDISQYEIGLDYYDRKIIQNPIWGNCIDFLFEISNTIIIKKNRYTFLYHKIDDDLYSFDRYEIDLYCNKRFHPSTEKFTKFIAEKDYCIRLDAYSDTGVVSYFKDENCFLTMLLDTNIIFCWNKEIVE